MSYTKKYNATVSDRISKRLQVSYSTNNEGILNSIEVVLDNRSHRFSGNGSKTVEINAELPVTVEIEVDTKPFDSSVSNCNSNVNLLTGAVVATEAAQIASIDKNSKKVANTVINGFFGYIKSEISQQISELTQNIDAQLMHLKELSDACVDKKRQMESDFLRISGRYTKIFDDLNSELSNRIHELDKPTFMFKKELDEQSERTTNNDMVNTVTVFGKEGGELQSKISASVAKKRALDTLYLAKNFLWQQKKLENTISKSMLNESVETAQYSPVCFIELCSENGQISKEMYSASYLNNLNEGNLKTEIINKFSDPVNNWTLISKDQADSIKMYFNTQVSVKYPDADPHSERVKQMIQKMADLGKIKVIEANN